MFKLLNPQDSADTDYLAQMHNLRYRVFCKTLGWKDGISAYSQMEFDKFDHDNCRYLVNINDKGRVDACTRLTPTSFPYLLGDVFSDFIEEEQVPRSPFVLETSRLCADSTSAPKNITGLLMAAMLELGLKSGIEKYVSLSDKRIIPIVHRYGWLPIALGQPKQTSTELSIALKYDVTSQFCDNVKHMVSVKGNMLEDTAPLPIFADRSARSNGSLNEISIH